MSREHGDHRFERRRAARRQLRDCPDVVLSASGEADDWSVERSPTWRRCKPRPSRSIQRHGDGGGHAHVEQSLEFDMRGASPVG